MLRLIRTAVLALLAAAPIAAQEAPRFLVERVDVRQLRRASPEIVVAESRIRAGESYSEAELRVAADRVARLPFVLAADFALEKGSVRDAYVLVINVTEAKPFFYLVDVVPVIGNDVVAAPSDRAAVGFRFFAGRRGMFHLGLSGENDDRPYTSDRDAFEAGYTHYDILGTRAFATFSLRRPNTLNGEDPATLPQLVVGVPISANQTVTALYSAIDLRGRSSSFRSRLAQRVATVRLTYNTTNHPFFPTRGVLLTVAPVAVWSDTAGVESFGGPIVVRHTRSLALEGTAARYWELNERDALSALVDGGLSDLKRQDASSGEGTSRFGSIEVGLSRRLTSLTAPVDEGESRIELRLRASTRDAQYFSAFRDRASTAVTLAWVKRNLWGNLRLGVGYGW